MRCSVPRGCHFSPTLKEKCAGKSVEERERESSRRRGIVGEREMEQRDKGE
jgi:hypothetical protein